MSEPVRVLLTIPNFLTAGSGSVVVELVESLDRDRVAPTVCVARRGGALQARLEAGGVEVLEHAVTVPARPLPALPGALRRAAAPLRGRFDVWHSWHYLDDYTEPLVARLAGARWMYTKKNMPWNRRAWLLRSAFAHRVAATNTDMLRDFFGGAWLRRRTRLVPLGIDVERFAAAAPHRPPGLPPAGPLVVCPARIIRGKGQHVVVAALADVPGAHLALAGRVDDEGYAAELDALAAELGVADRVHRLGHVDDVPGLLAAADVAVLASGVAAEGCPAVLLEAMAAGVACVATDTPGCRDLVADGATGRLVARDDPAAMAEGLRSVLGDPAARAGMGRRGREVVRAGYDLATQAEAYTRAYEELARRR